MKRCRSPRSQQAGSRVLLLFVDTRSGDQAEVVAGAISAGTSVRWPAARAAERTQVPERRGQGHTDRSFAVALVSRARSGSAARGAVRARAPGRDQGGSAHRSQPTGAAPRDVYLEKRGLGRGSCRDYEFESVWCVHTLAQRSSRRVRLRHVLGARGEAGDAPRNLPANAAVEFPTKRPTEIVVRAGRRRRLDWTGRDGQCRAPRAIRLRAGSKRALACMASAGARRPR